MANPITLHRAHPSYDLLLRAFYVGLSINKPTLVGDTDTHSLQREPTTTKGSDSYMRTLAPAPNFKLSPHPLVLGFLSVPRKFLQ